MNAQDAIEVSLKDRQRIEGKRILKLLYRDFYSEIRSYLPVTNSSKLLWVELGSGGGFMKDVIPEAVTSDVVALPGVDRIVSAVDMPFENNSVDAYVMLNVFHHISDSEKFLKEAQRTLKKGGRIVMIEPANTFFSRLFYKYIHQEDFNETLGWHCSDGRMSGSNQALAWIVFVRDRERFIKIFPDMRIHILKVHTPFRFLVSGGLSPFQLLPAFAYGALSRFEKAVAGIHPWCGMFYTIVLEKN